MPSADPSDHPLTGNTDHPLTGNTDYPPTGNTDHPSTGNTDHPSTGNTTLAQTGNTILPLIVNCASRNSQAGKAPPETGNSEYTQTGNCNPGNRDSQTGNGCPANRAAQVGKNYLQTGSDASNRDPQPGNRHLQTGDSNLEGRNPEAGKGGPQTVDCNAGNRDQQPGNRDSQIDDSNPGSKDPDTGNSNPGSRVLPTGNTEPCAGNTHPRAGNTDPPTGNTDPSAGNTDHRAGNTDHPTGNTDHPTGNTDHPTGNTDHPTGNTDPPTGNTDPPTGNTDPPTGNTDPPTGNTDPPTGNTDPPAGNTDPQAGNTDPQTGNSDSGIRAPWKCNSNEGNGASWTGNNNLGNRDPQPGHRDLESGISNSGNSDLKSGISNPGNRDPQPGHRDLESGISHQGNRDLESGISHPGNRDPQPGHRDLPSAINNSGHGDLQSGNSHPGNRDPQSGNRDLQSGSSNPGNRDLQSGISNPGNRDLQSGISNPGNRDPQTRNRDAQTGNSNPGHGAVQSVNGSVGCEAGVASVVSTGWHFPQPTTALLASPGLSGRAALVQPHPGKLQSVPGAQRGADVAQASGDTAGQPTACPLPNHGNGNGNDSSSNGNSNINSSGNSSSHGSINNSSNNSGNGNVSGKGRQERGLTRNLCSPPSATVADVAASCGVLVMPCTVPGSGSVTITSATATARQRTLTSSPVASQAPAPTISSAPRSLVHNLQLPAGMVLARSDSGQLVLVPQKAIAQAQARARAQVRSRAQATRTPLPTAMPGMTLVKISTVQAAGAQIIAKPVNPPVGQQVKAVTVQQAKQLQPTVHQMAGTAHRITLVQTPSTSGGMPAAVVRARVLARAVSTLPQKPIVTPAERPSTATATQSNKSLETLENVKKCKNFLATLIKLASGESNSPELANNVKGLVQKLLDGKMEVEDFTSQLYKELKSLPQPYLVPFLKRSLPTLRNQTSSSQLFVQQCLQQAAASDLTRKPGASSATSPLGAVRTALPITVTSTSQQLNYSPFQKAQQPKLLQTISPTPVTVQQSGVVVVKSQTSALPKSHLVTLASSPPQITVPVSSQIQLKQVQGVPPPSVQRVSASPGARHSLQMSPACKSKMREVGGNVAFRDEDDINDVASMAGVNICEENARILATNSEMVGTMIRSCKDKPFLSAATLQKRVLELGQRHGVTDVSWEVLNIISHATQERLWHLMEKLHAIAQHRMVSYKDDAQYSISNDARMQLKFFEQLEWLEKQRKDEGEREMLLRLAKSRVRQEDVEQMRLKQKAKEARTGTAKGKFNTSNKMQQMELAQIQQREANLTALAAIGHKKRKLHDSSALGAGNEGVSRGPIALGGLGSTVVGRPHTRPRVTRISLRDLLFCLDQEREMRHSLLLYRSYLK